MRTTISIAKDFLEEKKVATFKQIWNEVVTNKKNQWKKDNPKILLRDIESKKIVEFYVLLTISGDFVRLSNKKFGLVKDFSLDEINQMKYNVEEVNDL